MRRSTQCIIDTDAFVVRLVTHFDMILEPRLVLTGTLSDWHLESKATTAAWRSHFVYTPGSRLSFLFI